MAVTAVAGDTRTRWRSTWLAWGLWTLAIAGLVVLVWLDQRLRQTGRPELVALNPTAFAPVLGAVSTATVGQWWPAAGPVTRWAGSCWPSACP